jgi:predicted dehydrogenase
MNESRKKLRMGLIGGGPGAFIGEVHRKASRLDGYFELVAGAFDIDPTKSIEQGKALGLDPHRVYPTYRAMLAAEKRLPLDQRVDCVAVTTPNNWHFPIARDFLRGGFHVMCEKPMTMTSRQAEALEKLVEQTGLVFGLMHNYTGYPMAKLARDMVRNGELGNIRKIVVQYPQGWLATALEKQGQMQASWRCDPKQAGRGGCVGDIGTHAANLAEYISGLKITYICADLTTFVPGRPVDDDCNVLLRFGDDLPDRPKAARGVLHASQIAIGEENNLAIWIHGELVSLEWHQEHPNYLYVRRLGKPDEVWKRGNEYVGKYSPVAGLATRIPSGHPEAFLEAFANNYVGFAGAVLAGVNGTPLSQPALDFPDVHAGVRGMRFIETVVKSSRSKQKWVPVKQ